MKQPARVSDQLILQKSKHIDQHSGVITLDTHSRDRGAELLDGLNWFAKYAEVYLDYLKGMTGAQLIVKYGENILKTLQEKGAIELLVEVTIEI